MDFNPLEMSDDELRKCCENQAKTLTRSYGSCYAEIQRRSQDRHAREIKRLTIVAVVLAAVTTLAAVAPYLPCLF